MHKNSGIKISTPEKDKHQDHQKKIQIYQQVLSSKPSLLSGYSYILVKLTRELQNGNKSKELGEAMIKRSRHQFSRVKQAND